MMKHRYVSGFLFSLLFSGISHADVMIKSPEGGVLTFSQAKKGEHYDAHTWGKIVFSNKNAQADLSQDDRYYTEDGSSRVSPSGRYLIVNSISGGELWQEDGTVTWSDRAYCSVVDMKNGCITSDWSGEACGYTWVRGKDIIASSEKPDAETFNFTAMRPVLHESKGDFALMENTRVMNILRCDVPGRSNINDYQQLAKLNKASAKAVRSQIASYLNSLTMAASIESKALLFTEADEHSQTKAYLVAGDKIKIIQRSPDNQWVNVGYINAKGTPLVAWIKADTLIKGRQSFPK
ncbi:hypothetical protein [Serratia proteamaculans]